MTDLPTDARNLLCDLIAIPSINDYGRGGAPDLHGEQRMADYLESLLRGWGLRVEQREVEPGRPNLLAWLPSTAPPDASLLLLLDAHTDTVAVGDATDLLTPRVEGSMVRGRGAVDVKGPMTSILLALRALARGGGTAHCRVVLAATMGEERNLHGARHVVCDSLRPDAAVVAEPTSLELVRAHKGAIRYKIVSHGVAGHGAQPQDGHNAIVAMARLLTRLNETYCETYADLCHPLLGQPTFNVGVIHGGLQSNIIPDRCEVLMERRYLPGEAVEEVTTALEGVLHAAQGAHAGDRFTLTAGTALESLETPHDAPIVQALAAALGAQGLPQTIRGAQWTANSGVYAAQGIPTVVIGPGDTAQAHTVHESIDLNEVVAGVGVFEALMQRYGA